MATSEHRHPETPAWAAREFERLSSRLGELQEIAEQTKALVERLAPGPPVSASLTLTREEPMADLSVQDNSGPLNGAVTFKDALGNVAAPNDVPAWASSDETVASVAAAADGLSAVVTVVGAEGASLITVDSIDADGTDIKASMTLTVTAGPPATGEVVLTP